MKARPILMHARSVQNLLAGRKQQTRRIVKLPHNNPLGEWQPSTMGGPGMKTARGDTLPPFPVLWHTRTGDCIGCPYGVLGDLLWVRESFAFGGGSDPGIFITRADYPQCVPAGVENVPPEDGVRWSPSIHMPRRYSRLTLRLTDVRVERVRGINHDDIKAEGWPGPFRQISDKPEVHHDAALDWWSDMWVDTNGGNSWAANPWVWALTFEVLRANVDAVLQRLEAAV